MGKRWICTIFVAMMTMMTFIVSSQATTENNKSSSPPLWSLSPSIGPQAGGTLVTLTAANNQNISDCSSRSDNNVFVLFGTDQVKAYLANRQSVVTSSPMSGHSGDRQVWITCNNTSINTNTTFTYRSDPKIISVSPQANILAGGIRQTVIGTNLDPMISLITLDLQQPKLQTRLPCQPCQQALSNASHLSGYSCIVCRTTGSPSGTNQTQVSSSTPSTSSSSSSTFSQFLGITNATLVWDAWRYVFPLESFLNPLLQQLSPDPQNLVLDQEQRLQIQVLWPPFNVSSNDVTIRMSTAKANVVCDDVIVTSSSLSCKPPIVSTQFVRYAAPEEKTFLIQVRVGNDVTSVGHVIYVLDEPFNVIMIVMISLIVFVIILSSFYGCLALFHSKLNACCSSCCYGDDDEDRKMIFTTGGATLNGSQQAYQMFDDTDNDNAASGLHQGHGGVDQGHRQGRAKAGKKHDDVIEMIGSAKRVEV